MSVSGGWKIPGRVFYFKFIGRVTEYDVRSAIAMSKRGLEEVPPTGLTHSITDVSEVSQYDLKLLQLRNSLSGLENMRATGYAVIVGSPNSLIKFAITVASQLFGFRLHMSLTEAEAWAFLKEHDSTLPSFPVE